MGEGFATPRRGNYAQPMSEFADKIRNGLAVSDEDWNQYLQEAHRVSPSQTPAAFARYRTAEGQTSYEVLMDAVAPLRGGGGAILDLACGDGHLIPGLLELLGADGHVIGVDMSEGELEVARKKLQKSPRVQLYRATAQSLPLPDDAADAIVCHMAFMLMLPLDPVVTELHRVLKSGGTFSAVIGNARGKGGLFGDVLAQALKFIVARYPKFPDARWGDPRVQSEAGLSEVFSPAKGFSGISEVHDFVLQVKTDPQGVWDFLKDMYFVSMLPPEEKAPLKAEVVAFAASRKAADGSVAFDFQLRRFSAQKK